MKHRHNAAQSSPRKPQHRLGTKGPRPAPRDREKGRERARARARYLLVLSALAITPRTLYTSNALKHPVPASDECME